MKKKILDCIRSSKVAQKSMSIQFSQETLSESSLTEIQTQISTWFGEVDNVTIKTGWNMSSVTLPVSPPFLCQLPHILFDSSAFCLFFEQNVRYEQINTPGPEFRLISEVYVFV